MDLWDSNANHFSSPKIEVFSVICTTPLYKNEDFLRQKYEVEGLSARQIAVLISCSHDTVNRALEKFGIIKTLSKTGRVPYGWKIVKGKRVPHVHQQHTIKKIKRLQSQGWSHNKIADYLNKLLIPPANGSIWHPGTVSRTLKTRIQSI